MFITASDGDSGFSCIDGAFLGGRSNKGTGLASLGRKHDVSWKDGLAAISSVETSGIVGSPFAVDMDEKRECVCDQKLDEDA